MKTLLIIAALLIQATANAKNVKDLEVNCQMQAKVSEVSDITYSPGKAAHHRVPEIPSSLNFKASLEIVSQGEGCSILQSKYKIFLGRLMASGKISPASESQINEILALKNQPVELTLEQQIGFQIEGGHLPLFQWVHSESINLTFNLGNIEGAVKLPFDSNWVYGITKVENLTDIQKLALAEKVLPYVLNMNLRYAFLYDFHGLFLQLEPGQLALKKSYASLIWKMFRQKANSQVLRFHVGGDGSRFGEPLAAKLNKISHLPQMFSSAEVVQLLTELPTLLLAGSFSGNDCLNFSGSDLEKFLENFSIKKPVLTGSELFTLADPLKEIAGVTGSLSNCTQGKISDYSKSLALELLKK
jgi:hypothetical protein